MSDLRAKEIKRAALNEVLDYVSNYKGVLSEPVYPEVVRMVSYTGTHLYRQEVTHTHKHAVSYECFPDTSSDQQPRL